MELNLSPGRLKSCVKNCTLNIISLPLPIHKGMDKQKPVIKLLSQCQRKDQSHPKPTMLRSYLAFYGPIGSSAQRAHTPQFMGQKKLYSCKQGYLPYGYKHIMARSSTRLCLKLLPFLKKKVKWQQFKLRLIDNKWLETIAERSNIAQ